MPEALPPGSIIGILGGGQLGRMLSLAAARLGLETHIYSDEPDVPAFDVSAFSTVGSFADEAALSEFASSVDVVTCEFENVPARALEIAGKKVPVHPPAKAFAVAQDRLVEKDFMRGLGISLFKLLFYIRDEILIVAATTSTEAVLPRVIEKMRGVGCDESVVGLVVPAGYSLNLDGTCLYLATVVVFLAQATNTPLDLGHQLVVLAVLLLASKGAAGVAGAAFVVLAATLASLGTVPVASIALVLGIHRLLAEALTFVNSPEGRELNLRGINTRVVEGGKVRVGDPVRKL